MKNEKDEKNEANQSDNFDTNNAKHVPFTSANVNLDNLTPEHQEESRKKADIQVKQIEQIEKNRPKAEHASHVTGQQGGNTNQGSGLPTDGTSPARKGMSSGSGGNATGANK